VLNINTFIAKYDFEIARKLKQDFEDEQNGSESEEMHMDEKI
jgi:hypothetical protein